MAGFALSTPLRLGLVSTLQLTQDDDTGRSAKANNGTAGPVGTGPG